MVKVFSLNLVQTFLKTLMRSVVLTEAGSKFQYKTTFSETVDISILWVSLGLAGPCKGVRKKYGSVHTLQAHYYLECDSQSSPSD